MLKIKFDNLYSRLCIYGLGSNILRTQSGMCGLGYSDTNVHHNYCDYQENGFYMTNRNISVGSVPDMQMQNITEPIDNIIYKLITDNNKIICCITHENLGVNSRYMSCAQCHNNFNEDTIKQWFRQRSYQKTCPMCRINWTDFNIYINGVEPEPIEEPEPVVYTRDDPYLEGQSLNPPAST
jgi:hypothetical protein